jgi:hypothetical protein
MNTWRPASTAAGPPTPAAAPSAPPRQRSVRQEFRGDGPLALPLPAADPQRAGAADRVFEQLEADAIADHQVVDRAAFADIGAMEEDFAIVGQTDEPVSLADQQLDDSPVRHDASMLDRAGAGVPRGRRRLTGGAIEVRAHVSYQRGSERRRVAWPPP